MNPGPPGPEPGALAKLRYIPKYFHYGKEAIIDEGIREVNTKRIQDEENL